VRDLLPQASDAFSFKDELEAIETTLIKPFGPDIAEAVARTGQLLGDIFHDYKPKKPNEILPFRDILPRIASPLLRKLEKLNYWHIFNEKIATQQWSFLETDEGGDAEVIWLRHLKMLWLKHFEANDRLYGLAKIFFRSKTDEPVLNAYETVSSSVNGGYSAYATFVVKHRETICEAYDPIRPVGMFEKGPSRSYDFGRISPEEFRLFMIGLIIELIHIVSKALINNSFWKNLEDFFPQERYT
jgi:hypothetical protein